MNYPQLIAYLVAMRAAISQKTDIDSISPTDVGETGLADLVAILDVIIKAPNISANNFEPTGGSDGNIHLQGGTSLTTWQKINGVWTNVGSLDLGISFPDGNSTLKTSLDGDVATITPGFWYLNNNQYSKSTQTQFNISPADNTEETRDLIYANTSNQVLYIAGTPGLGTPALPSDSVQVDVVVIPSVASGAFPYLAFGFTDVPGSIPALPNTLVRRDNNGDVYATSLFTSINGTVNIRRFSDAGPGWAFRGEDNGDLSFYYYPTASIPFYIRANGVAQYGDDYSAFYDLNSLVTLRDLQGAVGSSGILIEQTSDSNGEYDASAAGLREFPAVTIYDASGLTSAAQYDNTTKKIIGLNPSETFKARFI